ncbi:hypothetical protein Ciccas_006643 [Cichlidogyrus casuarinus]|uniref:Uncharacterized protein n=1 Tax=Cichlidogyrus casuarinus TaxID=1844966 RepID=A0ABD2Q575_9PLAT
MCFGLVRTRWKAEASGASGISVEAGSLAVGINTLLNARNHSKHSGCGICSKPSEVETTISNGLPGSLPNRAYQASSTLTLMADVYNTNFESLSISNSNPNTLNRFSG